MTDKETDRLVETMQFVNTWDATPDARALSVTTRWLVRSLVYIALDGRKSVTISGRRMVIVVDAGHAFIGKFMRRKSSSVKTQIRNAKNGGILSTERGGPGMDGTIVVELCIPDGFVNPWGEE